MPATKKPTRNRTIRTLITTGLAALLTSCSLFESTVAELRTDVPEMAVYAAYFNASQSQFKIHVEYEPELAASLLGNSPKPALVVGKFIKIPEARNAFQSLDHLFSELLLNQSSFYPGLLELGTLEGRQLLLPVSFNLPLIALSKSQETSLPDNFVLSIVDLERLGMEYNQKTKDSFTRMGFGPRWSPEFMYAVIRLHGVDFKPGPTLKWNYLALETGIAYLRAWSERVNESILKEEEFQFKYLYLPAYRSLEEGRIAYAAMGSSDFFLIPEERRSGLAFRWLSKDGVIPLDDEVVYAGICRGAEGKQVAEAFLKWFYTEGTQRKILEDARRFRSIEISFGVAGGFSAIRSVNEKLFPLFYPSLLGRLPPGSYFSVPPALPSYWLDLMREVILPFLIEAMAPVAIEDPNAVLESRVQAWMRRRSGF
ncbi:MAG: hypothetical protein ABIJ86_13635 [Spirochaetota bacterium]